MKNNYHESRAEPDKLNVAEICAVLSQIAGNELTSLITNITKLCVWADAYDK
jgi:hypothetical protein